MKKTNKINLNQLAKKAVDMKKNEMKAVHGGGQRGEGQCVCCCWVVSDPEAQNPRATDNNSAT